MTPETFIALVTSNGLAGIFVGIVVLVAIYLLKFTEVLKAPWMRRLAAVVLPVLLSGVRVGDSKDSLIALIGVLVASLLHLLLDSLLKAKGLADKKA